MIFKPSELTPLGALKLGEILAEAGLPAGAFNVVQGGGAVGAALAAHPAIAKVSRHRLGPDRRQGLRRRRRRAEAGDARARRQVAAPRLRRRRPRQRGRRRHARQLLLRRPGLLERHPRLRRSAPSATPSSTASSPAPSAIVLGDPMDEGVQMGPLISAAQGAKVMDYIATGRAEGARLLTGGERARLQGFEGGFFVQPTVFAGVTDAMTIAREEIFGPVMSRPRLRRRGRGGRPRQRHPLRPRRRRLHPRPRPRPPRRSPGSTPAPPGSTPTTSPRSRRPSAASRPPASAARTAAPRSSTGAGSSRSTSRTGPVEAPF